MSALRAFQTGGTRRLEIELVEFTQRNDSTNAVPPALFWCSVVTPHSEILSENFHLELIWRKSTETLQTETFRVEFSH